MEESFYLIWMHPGSWKPFFLKGCVHMGVCLYTHTPFLLKKWKRSCSGFLSWILPWGWEPVFPCQSCLRWFASVSCIDSLGFPVCCGQCQISQDSWLKVCACLVHPSPGKVCTVCLQQLLLGAMSVHPLCSRVGWARPVLVIWVDSGKKKSFVSCSWF